MIGFCNNFILTAVIQVVLGQIDPNIIPRDMIDLGIYHPYQQTVPRYCWRPPGDIDIHKCCPIPNLYSDEVMDICAIEKIPFKETEDQAKYKDSSKRDCQDGMCLMKHANLLMANSSVDYEKLDIYLYKWAAAHPEFTDEILMAKRLCAKKRDETVIEGHRTALCDPDRIFVCLSAHILWNCKLKTYEECIRLREHMDECRPYYEPPAAENDDKPSEHFEKQE